MNRRRFVFWVSFGLFNVSETFGCRALDRLAAAAMRMAEPKSGSDGTGNTVKAMAGDKPPEHWTQNNNNTWHWFERETFVDGQWKLTGITTPTNIETGEPYTGHTGYLDESLVPADLLPKYPAPDLAGDATAPIEPAPHMPDGCGGATWATAEQMATQPVHRRAADLAEDDRRSRGGCERDDLLDAFNAGSFFRCAAYRGADD